MKKKKRIIRLKSDTLVYEDSETLYIFYKHDMCKIIKAENKNIKQFFNLLNVPMMYDQMLQFFESKELDYMIRMFNRFISIDDVKERILLIGDNYLSYVLNEKLLDNGNCLKIISEFNEKELHVVDYFDLIIVNQNTSLSPVYRYINDYCREKGIKVFNVLKDGGDIVVGPYFRNDGTDAFCYECFRKRRDANNINREFIRLREKITVSKKYTDKNFFRFDRYESIKAVADKVVEMIDEITSANNYIYRYDLNDLSKRECVHVYPIPFCKKCNYSLAYLYRNHKKFERNETSKLKLDFINNQYGMFRRLSNTKTILKGQEFYYYTLQVPSIFNCINDIIDNQFSYNVGGGVSVNKEHAISKAIGEAVERYCLEAYDTNSLELHSIEEIINAGESIMQELQLFDDWQFEQPDFPFKKINKYMKIYWVKAMDIINNKWVNVPASYVYTRFRKVNEKNSIGYLTTSGAAASVDFKSAVLYGIYELIERDCTMITWLQRLKVAKVVVDVETLDNDRLKKCFNILKINDISVDIYYITLDINIPCFWAVGHNSCNEELPAMMIGAGCRINKDEALIRALEEVIQGCGWSSIYHKEKNFLIEDNYKNVTDFRDRVGLYALKEMANKFDFLNSQNVIQYINIDMIRVSLEEEYSLCIKQIREKGMQILVKELTTPDVQQLGFTVVKVLIPQLQQIEANHNYRFLHCKRTKEIPSKLGYKEYVVDSKKYNKAPHPFP